MPRTRSTLEPKECCRCKQVLGEGSFSPSVWRMKSGACRPCFNVYQRGRPRIAKVQKTAIRCPQCKETKTQEAFTPSAWLRGAGWCRKCHTAYYSGQRSENNRTRLSQYGRVRRRKKIALVMEVKARRGCQFCKESHPAALDFHHRDKEHKVATVRALLDRNCTMEKVEAEMAKCDVICANCHRKLHYAEGATSYWGKHDQHRPEVIAEAEEMREQRNRDYPAHLKLA